MNRRPKYKRTHKPAWRLGAPNLPQMAASEVLAHEQRKQHAAAKQNDQQGLHILEKGKVVSSEAEICREGGHSPQIGRGRYNVVAEKQVRWKSGRS